MRQFIVCVMAACLVGGCGPAGDIKTGEDRFTGERWVRLEGMVFPISWGKLDLTAYSDNTMGGGFVVQLADHHTTWWWLECRSLELLVDGQLTVSDDFEVKGDIGGGGVYERALAGFGPTKAADIAAAQRLEGRLCGTEFELKGKHLDKLQAFIRKAAEVR